MAAFKESYQALRDIETTAKVLVKNSHEVTIGTERDALAVQARYAREALEALEALLKITF